MTRRRALVAVGAAVTLVLAGLALRTLDLGEVAGAIAAMRPVWLLPSLALLAVAVAIRVVRWRVLFVPATRPPLGDVAHALLVGLFFNCVLPLRAGEAARILVLNRRAGTSRSQILGTVAVERIYDVVALLLLLLVALPWLPDVTWLRTAAWLGGAAGLAAAVAVVALALDARRATRVVLWPLALLPFVTAERRELAAENLAAGLAGFRDARAALSGFALTVASWLVFALSFWMLTFGFELDLGPGAGLLTLVATGLGMAVPSGPAALGVFEAAVVVALAPFGVPAEQAVSYGLVLHAVNLVPYLACGVLLLAPGRR
ncbi:MAG TPA: lysylphosphatidylglycerol synthase transmembrane domain-containing protein [Gaiellaceae bacterium]|nr:lysylphosphatidylglycerol synthase transmembrane domain-containing protein [Gaiellaceae bacterium]